MKSWLAWLRKSGYEFTETVDEVNDCRTYDFGNGLVVIKWERKTGGLINNNGFTASYGSNKLIQEELKEILGWGIRRLLLKSGSIFLKNF